MPEIRMDLQGGAGIQVPPGIFLMGFVDTPDTGLVGT